MTLWAALFFEGPQSALSPGGAEAKTIANLLWLFVAVLGTIFVIVMAIMVGAMMRRHRGIEQEPLEHLHRPSQQTEGKLTRLVGGATVATALILLALIVVSVSTGKAISERALPAHPISIEVTAQQWWWRFRYMNDDASRIVVTANEIHVPVGRPVRISGSSLDVIHSFWVPGLEGKRDLIPSRVTTEWFEADRPGRFRGQCAEFCGLQHAKMAFWVVAEPQPEFDRWMAAQLADSVAPATPSGQRGEQVFLDHACVLCHTIRGTTAAGQIAPDLTHLASRSTIAAGWLHNTRGNLAGWIADPQSVKPGNHMATVPLQPDDMQPLLDYLESLK